MEANIDNANKFAQAMSGNAENDASGTTENFAQPGQYGAVTGQGFGGSLAKDASGNPLQSGGGEAAEDRKQSTYEGMGQDDSTATGGYGGDAFSRANQMGAGAAFQDNDDGHVGSKTGTSTPGYLQEGETPGDADRRAAFDPSRMKMSNMNTYGQQADDRGAKGNNYNEANDDPNI